MYTVRACDDMFITCHCALHDGSDGSTLYETSERNARGVFSLPAPLKRVGQEVQIASDCDQSRKTMWCRWTVWMSIELPFWSTMSKFMVLIAKSPDGRLRYPEFSSSEPALPTAARLNGPTVNV